MTVEELKDYLEFNMTLHPTSGVFVVLRREGYVDRTFPLVRGMLGWEENLLSGTMMLNIVVEVE